MNTTRRRLLAGSGTVALAGIAGCAGIDMDFITGEDAAEFEAGGQTREVEVTNVQAEYDRAVELFGERYQAAVFTALSTPQVSVLGETFNPVGDMDRDDLAEMIQERYDQIENVELESEYGTEILEQETTVGQYSADGRLAESDVTVDLVMHISDPVESGDDFVIGLGTYPEILGDGDAVRHLLNGIEHDAE